jgi:hypothetical protein
MFRVRSGHMVHFDAAMLKRMVELGLILLTESH